MKGSKRQKEGQQLKILFKNFMYYAWLCPSLLLSSSWFIITQVNAAAWTTHHHHHHHTSSVSLSSKRRTRKQEIISRSSTRLNSSIFDDNNANDDDFNWLPTAAGGRGTEEEYTNIQYQGNVWNNNDDDNENDEDDNENNFNGKKSPFSMEGTDVDDTDDSYYEQLFLQNALQDNEINDDSDPNDNEEKDEELLLYEQEQQIQKEKQYKQMIQQRNKTWRQNMIETQNEALSKRKHIRLERRRENLEERARLLALRALKQRQKYNDMRVYESSSTIGGGVSEVGSMTELKRFKPQRLQYPYPTLSLSSTRNYKLVDEIQDETYCNFHSKNKNNKDGDSSSSSKEEDVIVKLEEELYGKQQFKTVHHIYIRLLQTLEERKEEFRREAAEFVSDRMALMAAYQFVLSSVIGDDGKKMTTTTMERRQNEEREKHIMESIEANSKRRKRLDAIISLSLYTTIGGRRSSIDEDEQLLHNVENMDINDLRAILYIRGNVKRRGPLPKRRGKVLEVLYESLETDLF